MPHAPTPTVSATDRTGHAPHTPSAAPVCVCSNAGTPTLLYTADEAAKILKVSVPTLRRWRAQDPPQGPAYVRIGTRISYQLQDLQDYLTSRRVAPGVAA